MDVPVALGMAVTFVASTGATFDPGGIFGSEVYFDSMTMFVSFLLAARYLELHARHRAAQALEARARQHAATRASGCWPTGAARRSACMRLAPGDRVRVALGQAFPADGVLAEGAHTRRRGAAQRRIDAGAQGAAATRWWPAASTSARR